MPHRLVDSISWAQKGPEEFKGCRGALASVPLGRGTCLGAAIAISIRPNPMRRTSTATRPRKCEELCAGKAEGADFRPQRTFDATAQIDPSASGANKAQS